MINIYTTQSSSRLVYVLDWIFKQNYGIEYRVFTDIESWRTALGFKLLYADISNCTADLIIKPQGILFEQGIREHAMFIHRWKHSTILFYNYPSGKVPFDLFGAIFWLLSRYEEYLPFKADKHQRFSAKESVAAQFNFLQQPVVDEWLMHFRKLIEKLGVQIGKQRKFSFIPTYDIDIAYAYQHKPWFRQVLGGIKDLMKLQPKLVLQRINVCAGKTNDSYDNFSELESLHDEFELQPIYFWLLPKQNGKFDRNVARDNSQQLALIQYLSKKHIIGIHPSYQSNQHKDLLLDEVQYLSKVVKKDIRHSRQHYIKLHLPYTYRQLLASGITADFSMGYADCNGFRAGTSLPFFWYDLIAEASTNLMVYPFCFMEATAIFYQKMSPEKAYLEWERLAIAIHKVHGNMISIMHNYTLGGAVPFTNWRKTYKRMLQFIQEL